MFAQQHAKSRGCLARAHGFVDQMNAGDAWLQPHSAVHKVLDYSDGCEVLEIVMPANFRTVELEK